MIGIDIVDVKRINNLIERERFINRIFTEKEISYLEERHFNANTASGLIAAKEAVAKAFEVGISGDISFKDIEVLHTYSGAPYINEELINISKLMQNKKVQKIDINISHDGDYAVAVANLILKKELKPKNKSKFHPKILYRNPNSNKYDFGEILIIGGRKGMSGSVTLSAKAALRSGAGLVYILVPECIRNTVENKTTEEIVLSIHDKGEEEFGEFNKEDLLNVIQNKSVIAIGTGLGKGKYAKEILDIVLNYFNGPIVVDADAINILAKDLDVNFDDLYLTPHSMEFSRLSGYTLNEIEYDRVGSVENFLDRYDVNLLLKGRESIVANKKELSINITGNSGMATAGSGDVLTGIIAALLARENSYDMFKFAVFIHGLAGDLAVKKYGKTSLIASDIINFLPAAFGEIDEN